MEPVRINALPRGTSFTRFALALARNKNASLEASDYARRNPLWKNTPEVSEALRGLVQGGFESLITKAPQNPGTTSSGTWASPLAQLEQVGREFAEILRPQTIIGRLANVRRVPFNIRFPIQTAASSFGWTGAGLPARASELSLESDTLGHAKVSGICAFSRELIETSDPAAEQLIRNDLLASAVKVLDEQFIDPSVIAVADVSPSSISNGIAAIPSSGSTATLIANDFATMFGAAADADAMQSPVLIMRPGDRARLALKRDTQGGPAFPDVAGGSLASVPILTSNSVPFSASGGSIVVLLDAAEVLVADDNMAMVDASTEASVALDSAPSSSAGPLTSLFQANLAALRLTRFIVWRLRRTVACQVLDGCHW